VNSEQIYLKAGLTNTSVDSLGLIQAEAELTAAFQYLYNHYHSEGAGKNKDVVGMVKRRVNDLAQAPGIVISPWLALFMLGNYPTDELGVNDAKQEVLTAHIKQFGNTASLDDQSKRIADPKYALAHFKLIRPFLDSLVEIQTHQDELDTVETRLSKMVNQLNESGQVTDKDMAHKISNRLRYLIDPTRCREDKTLITNVKQNFLNHCCRYTKIFKLMMLFLRICLLLHFV